MRAHRTARLTLAPAVAAGLAGCLGGGSDDAEQVSVLPAHVIQHSVTSYPATTRDTSATNPASTPDKQDLLTAGLGKTGLAAAASPGYADPARPTAAELRRNALFANYRGVADPTSAGGYGRLYGPNIDLAGNDTLGEGLVPGKEYLASVDDGTGARRVVMAVQVPASFDTGKPCIVVGPSSGSRGVYGALGASSEWGLKRGCAVALTDAGKGMGLYDPADDTVNKVDGTRSTRSAAGPLSHFASAITDAARAAYNLAFPHRVAIKHAHSQINPEKHWGNDTLVAVRYALYALNQEYGNALADGSREARFDAANTLVIAGAVSNGGAAALQAAEQDTEGLIDGVVVNEPSAQPKATSGFGVVVGSTPVATVGKPLADYFTYANIYQGCASLAPAVAMTETSLFNYMTLAGMNGRAANRCSALAAKGLVTGTTTDEQATDALNKLQAYGFSAEHGPSHNSHYGLGNAAIIGMMYTNAYGRFGLADNLCGMSAGYVDASGSPASPSAAQVLQKEQSFAAGNGTVNGSPATVIYNDSVGGAKAWSVAVSPSTGLQDFALDAALCQRALVTGKDAVTGADLNAASTPTAAQSEAVRAGIQDVLLNGNLRGKPTLIVHGRHDALVVPNHSSRAYAAFNRSVEGAASRLSYVEVVHGQHFDAFLPLSGFDNRFVPLHHYFGPAMNAMYDHLANGAALPASQVVRATPRGGAPGAAPAITAANLPPIAATPAEADRITFDGATLRIPH